MPVRSNGHRYTVQSSDPNLRFDYVIKTSVGLSSPYEALIDSARCRR